MRACCGIFYCSPVNVFVLCISGYCVEKKTQLFALQVTDGHGFWKWTQDTMLKAVYLDYHYNGNKTTVGEEQYMWDMAQFRVGGVRLRQVRVQPGEKLVLYYERGRAVVFNIFVLLLDFCQQVLQKRKKCNFVIAFVISSHLGSES